MRRTLSETQQEKGAREAYRETMNDTNSSLRREYYNCVAFIQYPSRRFTCAIGIPCRECKNYIHPRPIDLKNDLREWLEWRKNNDA